MLSINKENLSAVRTNLSDGRFFIDGRLIKNKKLIKKHFKFMQMYDIITSSIGAYLSYQ